MPRVSVLSAPEEPGSAMCGISVVFDPAARPEASRRRPGCTRRSPTAGRMARASCWGIGTGCAPRSGRPHGGISPGDGFPAAQDPGSDDPSAQPMASPDASAWLVVQRRGLQPPGAAAGSGAGPQLPYQGDAEVVLAAYQPGAACFAASTGCGPRSLPTSDVAGSSAHGIASASSRSSGPSTATASCWLPRPSRSCARGPAVHARTPEGSPAIFAANACRAWTTLSSKA